jgi:CII-binding regulator of phage lambda lysogenization HflD
MANNGHDPTRLDRLEGLVEVLVNRHLEFEEEHKRLLIAQVVLNDQLQRLGERVNRLDEKLDRVAEFQKHSDERLDALIAIVDEVIRKRPPSASA